MKAPWDRVKLTVTSWIGPEPEGGDELHTASGRRYQILEVKPKALICMVLPADAPVQGRVFCWTWNKRKRA